MFKIEDVVHTHTHAHTHTHTRTHTHTHTHTHVYIYIYIIYYNRFWNVGLQQDHINNATTEVFCLPIFSITTMLQRKSKFSRSTAGLNSFFLCRLADVPKVKGLAKT